MGDLRFWARLGPLASATVCLALSACTTVKLPTQDATVWAEGPTYPQAMSHLKTAYDGIRDKQAKFDTFDDTTKAGTWAGVYGVVIGSVFKSGLHPILTSATVAGGSYQLNQIVHPPGVQGVYSAGLSNLNCIREAANAAHGDITELGPQLRVQLVQLETAQANLRDDILTAGDDPTYAADVTSAQASLAKAEAIATQMRRFLNEKRLASLVVAGVDRTLDAVNQEARRQSPDIETIFAAGGSFNGFLTTSQQLRTDLRATVAGMKTVAISQAEAEPLQAKFDQHERKLRSIMAQVPSTTLSADLTSIANCQAQFAAAGGVTVAPSGPLTLTAGDTLSFLVTGQGPFTIEWIGETPRDVRPYTVPQLTLTADAEAKAKTYLFRVKGGKSASADITLNVVARPPPPETVGHGDEDAEDESTTEDGPGPPGH